MALPKLPTLKEVIANPKILEHLPEPFLLQIRDQLLHLKRELGGAANAHPTPTAMAVAHPKYKWMDTRHIHFLGERIAETVSKSKDYGESGALMVNEPPRHAKSHTGSVWTPFWHLSRYPSDNVLMIGAEHQFSSRWGEKVRRLVELHGSDYNLKLNPKKIARDDWELTTGGGMKCLGAGGTIAGNPAKLLVLDDVVKNDEEARSDYQREKIWDWWEGTVLQRIEPDTTVILIGTRYHEDDLFGRILLHSLAGDGLRVELVTLAAKAEDDDPLGRTIGEGLWLEHFPQSFYDEREKVVSPYVWQSVYQQRPTAPGGNMVDPAWWRYYTPSQLPQSFDQEAQSWDLSLDAQKKTDSQHAGIVGSRRGAVIYLRDGFAEHCDINKVFSTIRGWNVFYPRARAKLVERATAGVALQQTMRHDVAGIIPWPPKGRQKGSKEAELDAIIPAIRSGNVLLPLNSDGSKPKWVVELVDQCRAFPRGKYDDLVDTLSQLVNYFLPGVRASVGKDQRDAPGIAPQDDPDPSAEHNRQLHAVLKRMGSRTLDRMKEHQKREDRSIIPFSRGFRTGTGGGGGGGGGQGSSSSGMW